MPQTTVREERPEPAEDLDDLFEMIREAKATLDRNGKALGMPKRPAAESLWYRGVPRSEFDLIPSLLRFDKGLDNERALYDAFVEHQVPEKRDWEALFEMQHYFIPTRLLDWSTSFGVGLHFALHGDVPRDTPTVWVLDPGILNYFALPKGLLAKLFGGDRPRALATDQLLDIASYKEIVLQETNILQKRPIAIAPEAAFPRLRAQRGRFTVHSTNPIGLEDLCPEAVQRIPIKNTAVDKILDRISELGIDAVSMFPDRTCLASQPGPG